MTVKIKSLDAPLTPETSPHTLSSTMTARITALDTPIATLGECPVWSPDEEALYWVDIDGQAVHRHDPASAQTTTRPMAGRPGAIALTKEPGTLVVAVEHQMVILDWDSGAVTSLAELEAPGTGNRLNDGRCDPAGRLIIGSMYADTNAGRTSGILHSVEGQAHQVLRRGIGVTNGLAFDPERSRMYFADTPTEQVLVFDYDIDTGDLSNERLFFDYRDVPGKPDGACVDADGCYWSASVYGWALLRITPDGTIDQRVDLPLEKPSMPCFGGPDLDTLFVTTIGAGGTSPSVPGRSGFAPGSTLAVTGLEVRGQPEPTFSLPPL